MKMQGAISVTTAGDLEAGDLFAYETSGMLVAGVVKNWAYAPHQLNDVGRNYLSEKSGIEIPASQYEPISGGQDQVLVVYQAVPWFGPRPDDLEHIFLMFTEKLAVFHYDRAHYNRDLTTVPECGE